MIDTLAQPIANRTQPPAPNGQFRESRGEDIASTSFTVDVDSYW